MLERYGHGGDLRTAEELYGRPMDDRSMRQWLDFSANMNPFGPPKVVAKIMQEKWQEIAHYPDPAVRELRRKLAKQYQLPEESILVGNGAAELIDLVVRVLRPKVTAIARPSFSEYEEAVVKTGGSIWDIPLHAEHDFILQEKELGEALEKSDTFFLGHPNNPTGKRVPLQHVQRILDAGKKLVLDEAFMDFLPEEEQSFLQKATQNPDLIVIRSVTKFFAIPGIRVGFLVAHPSVIARLKELQVPWSVNYLAQLIGTAVWDESEYIEQTKRWLAMERPWLMDQLRALGLRVFSSDTNFLLFSLPQQSTYSAKQVQKHLAKRGILLRDASLFKGLNESYCRCAIRLRQDNERFVAAFKELLEAGIDEADER
ncbi:threonine-phosphate decarboxylase CobD [Brevibacillus ginsengisoli]|uniref:threonine-phosphate decarboxylase CobD n=1 Tax=Brevibacillus ginsengisoli TaxID=363854 RepID=UPI003CF7414C